jgi:hypothetical protein
MKLHRWSGLALLGSIGALLLACGDDDGGDSIPPPPAKGGSSNGGTGTGGSAPTGGKPFATGGNPSLAGSAGAGDEGGASGEGGSNSAGGSATGGVPFPVGGAPPAGAHVPNVTPEQTGEVFLGDPVEGFEVTHSHYYALGQTIADYFWLGVVVNDSDEMKCQLTVSVGIEAPGSAPVQFVGPVVARMYRFEGMTNRVYCLAPGETGVAVAQLFENAAPFAPEEVTAITYGVAGEDAGEVIPADWVELRSAVVESQGLKSRVSGDIVKLSAAAVSGLDAVVFPKNADGAPLFYYRLRDPRMSAPAGSLWHFQTPFYDGNFEDAFVFYEHGTPGAP